jgi:DNA mismatch repair ATPase MutL
MARPGHRIKLLSHDVSNSMVDLPCMSQAVAKCLDNSIKAKAKRISITVNYQDLSFGVEDDGCGISAADMQVIGNQVGNRQDGFHRASLRAIGQLARVDIDTRAKGSFDTLHKTIHAGKLVKLGLSMHPRTRAGTSIVVTQFLSNQPVRQKLLSQTRWVINCACPTQLPSTRVPRPQGNGSGTAAPTDSQDSDATHIRSGHFDLLHHRKEVASTGLGTQSGCMQSSPASIQVASMQQCSQPCVTNHRVLQGGGIQKRLAEFFWEHKCAYAEVCIPASTTYSMSICSTCPPSGYTTREHQLIYANNRPVNQPSIADLVEHWFSIICDHNCPTAYATAATHSQRPAHHPGFFLHFRCPPSDVKPPADPYDTEPSFAHPELVERLVLIGLAQV